MGAAAFSGRPARTGEVVATSRFSVGRIAWIKHVLVILKTLQFGDCL
jgi:hypothetical protein